MSSKNSKQGQLQTEAMASKPVARVEASTIEKNKAAVDALAKNTDAMIPTPVAEDDFSKIQELLFGDQLRAVNQKIMLVHKDFKQSMTELEQKLDQQVRSQGESLKKDISNVVEQWRIEIQARENAVENAGLELKKSDNNLQDRISTLEQSCSTDKNAFAEQLAQLQHDFTSKLGEVQAELHAQLEGTRSSIADNKVDRAALSELLGGIAKQIGAIDQIPTLKQETEAANTPPPNPNKARSA